jgi:hypothetical protein
MSSSPLREIYHLVEALIHLRQRLDEGATRIYHGMVELASLSQSVMQLTNIVSDVQSYKIESASSIAEDTSASDFAASTD